MGTSSESLNMKAMILASFLAAAALAAPEARFSCSECVDEMHKLGWMVKMGAVPIHDYVAANYCPTLGEDQGWCEEALSRYYVGMLFAIVEHYFVDGAIHVCQTGGACDAVKEYTCDECIQGLEQNYCISGGHHDLDKCKRLVVEHFANMHMMAMEKFFIPTEICMNEPVCGATKPPLF